MSQTSFSVNMPAFAKSGQLYDSGENDIVSFLAEEAIPFGRLVVRGTLPESQCKLPAASGDVTTAAGVLGIAVHDDARESQAGSAAPSALIKDAVSVLRKGRIVVLLDETVTVASAVFVRYAAGGQGPGSFGDTAGTSERAALAGAKWVVGGTAGGFAVVELNQ